MQFAVSLLPRARASLLRSRFVLAALLIAVYGVVSLTTRLVLSVRSLTTRGLRDLFLIVFLHVETRRVLITPSTTNPNETWMIEQARAFIRQLPDDQTSKFHLQHDRDTKFSAAFDEAIESAHGEIVKTPFRSPNLQAFVERFHQIRVPAGREASLTHALPVAVISREDRNGDSTQ